MSILLNVVTILFLVLLNGLLLAGLVLCRKYRFTAGFYFFIIQLALNLFQTLLGPYLQSLMLSYAVSNSNCPMEFVLKELAFGIQIIYLAIEIIAYCILVVGLYKWWSSKRARPTMTS